MNDPDKGLGGSFSPSSNTIEINSNGNAFDDPRTAIRTLVHEARHAYQEKQNGKNNTDFEKMCNYNNKNYTSSSDDYVRYKEQFIERDSRKFGNNTANEIISQLNKKWGH